MTHIFHEYDITDHAITYFSIDFQPQNNGTRVFRAPPSLLKNKEYASLINNLILRTVLDDVKDQNYPNFIHWRIILLDKEAFEQKKISPLHGTNS